MISSEALSPPKPAESLRERLIREGTIVPSENLDSLTKKIIELNSKLLKIIKFNKNTINSYIGFCDSVLGAYILGRLKPPNYLCAFLILKKLEMLKRKFLNDKRVKFNLFNVYRCGFFFAFKENKKNTP